MFKKGGGEMVKEICKDVFFLGQKSDDANKNDLQTAIDLNDTLKANKEFCVGMAANMIGVNRAAIIVNMGFNNIVMFNPKLLSCSGEYETEEGCLSLSGVRKTKRYRDIEIEYIDMNWQKKKIRLSGFYAQIAQHELDHLNGILI